MEKLKNTPKDEFDRAEIVALGKIAAHDISESITKSLQVTLSALAVGAVAGAVATLTGSAILLLIACFAFVITVSGTLAIIADKLNLRDVNYNIELCK